jgi:hypothetical protein
MATLFNEKKRKGKAPSNARRRDTVGVEADNKLARRNHAGGVENWAQHIQYEDVTRSGMDAPVLVDPVQCTRLQAQDVRRDACRRGGNPKRAASTRSRRRRGRRKARQEASNARARPRGRASSLSGRLAVAAGGPRPRDSRRWASCT